jgi:hypothetical protein
LEVIKMLHTKCSDYARLEAEVEENLNKLTELTAMQLETFRSKKYEAFMRLDKELELMVGKKERAIGALREHAKQHACQPGPPQEKARGFAVAISDGSENEKRQSAGRR